MLDAAAREVEDLDAVIAEAGGFAHPVRRASGGALALEAAGSFLVERMAVYEIPYLSDNAILAQRSSSVEEPTAVAAEERRDNRSAWVRLCLGRSGRRVLKRWLLSWWEGVAMVAGGWRVLRN
ncbi:hypothetical protein [Kribbella sp. NPDC004536]|uniref:hypothetical protein n=1 Tax=Kribbella sp. NPDC004536 TaxID=3364106 RepID=UPI00368787C2